MGGVTVTPGEVLAVIGGAVGLVTAIWHAAMYVGKLTVKVERHEDRLNDHDERLDRADRRRGDDRRGAVEDAVSGGTR